MTGLWLGLLPLAAMAQEGGSLSVEELSQIYTTPQAIAQFLRREFTFQSDEKLFGEIEHWQSPEEFLARRAGDCEDYAILAQALLAHNGIESYVFSLFDNLEYAHTVCVFVDQGGRYSVINQDRIVYYRADSLEELASFLYPGWTFGGITQISGTRGRLVKKMTNSHPAPTLVFDIRPLNLEARTR